MLLMCSSCASTERITAAATTQGRIASGISLPAWPDDCRKAEPHAAINEGDELRAIVVRERAALDKQNARGGRCASFYDDVKTKFEKKQ